jgi:hypothetical protein
MKKTNSVWLGDIAFYEGSEYEFVDKLEERERRDVESGWYP